MVDKMEHTYDIEEIIQERKRRLPCASELGTRLSKQHNCGVKISIVSDRNH
jgi:hypothetical protein